MTVLVTGGSGLVGSHVIEALRARGEPVRALVRDRSRAAVQALGADALAGDVTDLEAWRRAARGVRGIVHAAALVAPRATYEEFERVNVGATRLAVLAARAESARLVHISSVAVYGRASTYQAGRGAVAEDFPLQPLSPHDFYARTKRLAEDVVRDAAGDGLTAVALRPNVIYGERDRLFTPRVLATVRRGIVPGVGPGTNQLSCVYAGNVAAAAVAALDRPLPGGAAFRAYNVTHDAAPPLTQREFFAAFGEAAGVRVRWVRVPMAFARAGVLLWNRWMRLRDPERYGGLAGAAVWFLVGDNPYDANRARVELGWVPPFDARAAIGRTVRGSSAG